jgi:hypothetical protein
MDQLFAAVAGPEAGIFSKTGRIARLCDVQPKKRIDDD